MHFLFIHSLQDKSASNKLSFLFFAANNGVVSHVVESNNVVFEFTECRWELWKVLLTLITSLDAIAEVVGDSGVLLGFARVAD